MRPDSSIFTSLDLPTPNDVRTGSGAPGADYWQQQVDYVIEASLDAETNVVTGREIMTYTNNSPDALDYIWLHVEQNIFRCDSIGTHVGPSTSIGMNESYTKGCEIESVTAGAGGVDLSFVVYDTLARVDLPAPLAPGGGVFELEIAWRFTIPADTFDSTLVYPGQLEGFRPADDGSQTAGVTGQVVAAYIKVVA